MKTKNTENIICPYCGYEDLQSYEYGLEDDDNVIIYCLECDEEFEVYCNIEVRYSTKKLKEK